MNLYLVRHGESEGNVDHSVYENTPNQEIVLTEKGIQEIHKTAKQIKRNFTLHSEKNLSAHSICIITSPFRRTIDSAKIIAKKLERDENIIIQEPLLSELSFGVANGVTSLDSYISHSPIERLLAKQKIHYKPERGESLLDLYVRVGLFVSKYDKFSSCSNWIIISHAGVCALLHAYLTNDPPQINIPWWENGQIRKYNIFPDRLFAKEMSLD